MEKSPTCMTIDANGNLVILHQSYQFPATCKVQVLNPAGDLILKTLIVQRDDAPDREEPSNRNNDFPSADHHGMCLDANQNLVVTATSFDAQQSKIKVFNLQSQNGELSKTFGPNFVDATHQTPFLARSPVGVAVDFDTGNYVVSDARNSRILVISPTGELIRQIGTTGPSDGQLSMPWGLCLDRNGNIIVADRGNSRVQIFSPTGEFIMKFGGTEILREPTVPLIDKLGNIWVLDTYKQRVLIFG